jgi:hypothetical protein
MEIQEAIDIRYEEIEGLQQKLTEDHYMNPEQEDELEELITKAIKFGELCAQRDAKAQVIPDGFEQAYSKIFSPIVKRPYPRLENGNYKYIEIDQGWKLWQAATAQAVTKWISVDDELPSEGDLLLGISTTKLAKFNVYQVVALDEFDDCEITHWMHLPQAPKAQEQSHV